MVIEFALAGLGLVILLLAGDVLVKGAVNLSLRLGIPALIVSLTVVAFGTSAPELLISIKSVLDGVPGLALGNVVGSNTANILLVLGIPALISGLHAGSDTQRTYMVMIFSSVVFIGLAFAGPITWWHSLVLLSILALVLLDAVRAARAHRREVNGASDEDPDDMPDIEDLEEADPDMPWWQIALYVLLGLIGLPLGADLLVDSSIAIATAYGVSDTVIGLTLVAVGTSLPELATTVMAAIRRHADVALGNVIGSNMFNLLAIIGVAALVGPIPVDPAFLGFDLWVMLAASLVLAPFVFLGLQMGRLVGLGFSALYVTYILYLLS
ncbi:K+-dependent Na+/Ca+ exchanger related protein-protein [Roseibacterium elongatum DSM 19469]|uniref:K+-dependent Na+/Ca+ exchanger related protein-protein n=1 Tax=Roseicyclus elongatus DSM 19469 TaxID=1294273 RepID=W8RPM9_9RHOB|nr:calcium/sodium antiporter [Roseibacterium elongatum]AHM03134.1 K+-dependent Na+/Ca+ exchanger related protein-protein [Roseibacterium elongatum DSM 19469]